ncbi:MAG: UbiA family prenyltransferase [Methanococcaceae archaeon]
MKKIKGLFRLLRFELPFSAGICVIIGQILALGSFPSPFIILAGFASVFFISASILVLNDYFDVETDKINAPERPIPSKLVTPNEALTLAIVILTAGLLLAALLNFTTFVCAVLLFIIGFLYNWKYKKTGLPGNLMVCFSVGMTFIFGSISVGQPLNKIVLLFSLIAALIDLGEEIAADSVDVKGDAVINSNSLAIKYGSKRALYFSISIFTVVILLSSLPFILHWLPNVFMISFAVMDFFIAYSSVMLLRSDDVQKRKYIRLIYLGTTLGLVILLVLRLAVS